MMTGADRGGPGGGGGGAGGGAKALSANLLKNRENIVQFYIIRRFFRPFSSNNRQQLIYESCQQT